jgi:hypothetical protein
MTSWLFFPVAYGTQSHTVHIWSPSSPSAATRRMTAWKRWSHSFWPTGKQAEGPLKTRVLDYCSSWTLFRPILGPYCVDPGTCDVELSCFNTPVTYLILSTNRLLLHVNTKFTLHTTKTVFASSMKNAAIRAIVQQMAEIGWLTKSRDSICEGASKTEKPYFVSRILVRALN